MFRVSTLDLANLPRTPEGKIDFAQDFFGREAFLTVSGQLNVEAYCLALSKVYTFGPTFRAENSNTSRHLAEFWMVEPEIAFAGLAENADLAEALLRFVFQALLEERAEDMAFFEQRVEKGLLAKLEGIVDAEFARRDLRQHGLVPLSGGAGDAVQVHVSRGAELDQDLVLGRERGPGRLDENRAADAAQPAARFRFGAPRFEAVRPGARRGTGW